MKLLAIDPGNVQSAYVILETETLDVLDKAIVPNPDLLEILGKHHVASRCVVEMVASYGMAVGKTVFETVYWIGRFAEKWNSNLTVNYHCDRIVRMEVKMHLCHDSRAKDTNIRQALIDIYPGTGGGKNPQVGTIKQPGPLYGFSKDLWAALGVGVTYASKLEDREVVNL